jgi:16S rRNA C967 or C1407 C5-methylase (RsmB/RsmF family)
VTLGDGRYFGKYPQVFDRVLIDAPCSATGAILEEKGIRENYSLRRIHSLSEVQKGLLSAGYKSLKPQGILVYSTCSLEPEENELPVNYLLEKTEAELQSISLKPKLILRPGLTSWGEKEFNPAILKTRRLLPHENPTRGYFFAVVKKP